MISSLNWGNNGWGVVHRKTVMDFIVEVVALHLLLVGICKDFGPLIRGEGPLAVQVYLVWHYPQSAECWLSM